MIHAAPDLFTHQSFHNSTNLPKPEAKVEDHNCRTQEMVVIEIFHLAKKPLSWSEVSGFTDIFEGSIKRALTNLMTRGMLRKTTDSVISKYGKKCYRYELVNNHV